VGIDEHPNGLSDQVDVEKHVHDQKPEKFLIIFTTNAVVQECAVMVELLRTPPTLFAMVGPHQPETTRIT
jgi:hypothetical protein